MTHLHLGDVTIDRLIELEGLGYEPNFFFPDATMEGFEGEMGWLLPHFWDSGANTFLRSIQSYVVRTGHHTILVDSCVGHGKERPSTPAWDRLDSTWLDQLIAAGVQPEEIDYVLCTHLHADHIGWNTRLENGRWVPTFPNAKYVFHKDEFRYWEEHGKDWAGPGSLDGGFEDSVLPVMQAGQVALVDNDFAIDDHVTLEPTPGHSPGHVCIDVRTSAGHVVLSGDVGSSSHTNSLPGMEQPVLRRSGPVPRQPEKIRGSPRRPGYADPAGAFREPGRRTHRRQWRALQISGDRR